ncbi:MAG: alpha/beta hydrolase [bacterium]
MSTFILVPGAGGSAFYWHLVVPELEALGHEAIAVQLPADSDDAGLEVYAETVARAAGDRTGVILVAQSMGALTAPLVVERTKARMIVLVNAMIPLPGESGGAWWENTGQAEAMRKHAAEIGIPGLSMDDGEALFGHDVPPHVFEQASEHILPQSGRPFGDPWPLSSWPDIPTRVVLSRDDRLFPAEFQRRVALQRLGLVPDELDGGHLVALSQPKKLAAQFDLYSRA